jgi:hypothetical protein
VFLGTGDVCAGPIFSEDFQSFSPDFYANPGSPITSGGWTFANHAGIVTNVLGTGNKAVRLESGGTATYDPTISRVVAGLSVGTVYHLAWDWALKVNWSGSGTGRSFGVFLDTQTFGDSLFLGERLTASFTSASVDFVATATSHTIIFAGELDSRSNGLTGTSSRTDVSYWLDNVELTALIAAPEPGTLALFALGGAMLLPTARRRKRLFV